MPQSVRIAVLTNPTHELHGLWMHNLTVATRTLGLQLHVAELRSPEELDSAFAAMTQAGADALVVLSDPVLLAKLYDGRRPCRQASTPHDVRSEKLYGRRRSDVLWAEPA